MATNWSMERIPIPDANLSKSERDQFAEIVANYVKARSLKGSGQGSALGGKKWTGKAGVYTAEYATIKGRKSPVDLKKTGDMLGKLKALEESSAQHIRIGFDAKDKIDGKVEGNRRGTYGQSRPISGKARDFLKVSETEVAALLKIFNKDDNGEQ